MVDSEGDLDSEIFEKDIENHSYEVLDSKEFSNLPDEMKDPCEEGTITEMESGLDEVQNDFDGLLDLKKMKK